MSSPSPVTDGTNVWVMTGTGILKAFDFDGNELWSRDIQKDYGRFGLQLGLRLVAAAARGCALRAGAARHEDRRSVVPAAHRQGDRQDGVAGRAADARRAASRPTPTRRRRCCATAPATEIVVTGGDVVTGHDPGDRQGAVARRRAQSRATTAATASSPRRSCSATSIYRAVARAAAARAQSRRPRRRHAVARAVVVRQRPRRADAGHRRHVSLRRSTIAASCGASTRRPASEVYGPQRLQSGDLQRLAGAGRRQDLRHQRRRRDGGRARPGPKFELLAENDLDDYTLSSPAISDGQIFIRTSKFLYAIGMRQKRGV